MNNKRGRTWCDICGPMFIGKCPHRPEPSWEEIARERASYADALERELAELKSYLPKVPTQPYEKQMAQEIEKLRAALDVAREALAQISKDKTKTIASDSQEFMDGAYTAFGRSAETADEALERIDEIVGGEHD